MQVKAEPLDNYRVEPQSAGVGMCRSQEALRWACIGADCEANNVHLHHRLRVRLELDIISRAF